MSTVLLVDDSPSDRLLMRKILGRDGHEVVELSRGAEVVSKARELRPHVIVLDINLPDSDGFTICRKIRQDSECSGIPVLMLTVQGNASDVLQGLEAGADDYVAKDEAHEVILARIRKLIEYRRMATSWLLNEQLAQIGRLLAGIVHEIRAPLSVIRGNAELLKYMSERNQPVEPYIEPILRGTHLLQVRLEHLMTTVRRGSGPKLLCDVEPLILEAVNIFIKGGDVKRGHPNITILPFSTALRVHADPGRLIQVLMSLLGNAFEALGKQGEVVVAANPDPSDSGFMEISVADDGPGIPPALIGRVFEPFFTTKAHGSGYGLYLASEIVREQGGSLRVDNLPDGGAKFTIRLPSVEPEGAPVASSQE